MATDSKAKQIVRNGSEGPYKVFVTGDDLLDLGVLDPVADGQPQSVVSGRLGKGSFIHLLEKSGILKRKANSLITVLRRTTHSPASSMTSPLSIDRIWR